MKFWLYDDDKEELEEKKKFNLWDWILRFLRLR